MKIIKNFSKAILIFVMIFLVAIVLVALTIDKSYDHHKICRSKIEVKVENYKTINNVDDIKLLETCDKIVIYLLVDDSINKDNINSVILQFINLKIKYNDDEIIELIIKNNDVNYIVIIDENETIDIDFES